MIKGRNITITTTDSFEASKQACKVEREVNFMRKKKCKSNGNERQFSVLTFLWIHIVGWRGRDGKYFILKNSRTNRMMR